MLRTFTLLLSTAALLTAFGCDDYDTPSATINVQLVPDVGTNYEVLSLDLDYVQRIDVHDGRSFSQSLYTEVTDQGVGSNPYANYTYHFGRGIDPGPTLYTTSVEPISGIDFNFGNTTLVDLRSGDTLRIATCVPDYIALDNEVNIRDGGSYTVTLSFLPDNVHTIDGIQYLDFEGSSLIGSSVQ